jgi:hypothetical protein
MKRIILPLFILCFAALPLLAQNAWVEMSNTDKMSDTKSVGFMSSTDVPGTSNKARLVVNCGNETGKDELSVFVSVNSSVIDTSFADTMKWRFDNDKPRSINGWHRGSDGDIIFLTDKEAVAFINAVSVTKTLLLRLSMYSVGLGNSYPIIEFNVAGLSQKLSGHCNFHAPVLSQEQGAALQMEKLKENSAFGQSSPAAAASLAHDGHALTAEEMANEIKSGRASKCAVITSPPGAEVFVDGNKAGITPLVFVLSKRDAKRTITVSLVGYKTFEKQVDPDGTDIPVGLTLEPAPKP